jgi:hypothetical protein
MELKDLQSAAPEVIDVAVKFDDDGKPTAGFKVVGANSKQYQEADRLWRLKNVRASARRGRGLEASTQAGAAELVDMVAKREAAIAAACIVELYGFTHEGAPAQLNEDTLKIIFDARPTWRSKVVVAVESEQVFTQG